MAGRAKEGSAWPAWLAWGWLAVLIGAAIWAKAFGQGPIAWIETKYVVATGAFMTANLLILLLILALPSIWALLRGPGKRGAEQDRALGRRWAIGLLVVAGACLMLAIFGGVRAAMLPDGREAAVPIGAEVLTHRDAPTHRVAISGAEIGAYAGFDQPQKNGSRHWLYRGFRPAGASDEGPVALFLEQDFGGSSAPPGAPRPTTVEGYLIEDGLPAYARIVLERQGVRIAAPHYLLRDGGSGLRDGPYLLVMLGLIFGAIFAFIGTMALLVARGVMPIGRPRA